MIDWIATKHEAKYTRMSKSGADQDRIAREMIADERAELKAAEIDIDPSDRERIERAVAYGASELRFHTPRVRFFDGRKFSFGGIFYRDYGLEVWVDGTRPLREMKTLALHETAHVEHFSDGLGADLPAEHRHELRERDAHRFAQRGVHW